MSHEDKINNVRGTMELEGLELTSDSREILDKYSNKELTYEQIVADWKEKYNHLPKRTIIEQNKKNWKFACDVAPNCICPYVTSDGPLCEFDKCSLEEKWYEENWIEEQ